MEESAKYGPSREMAFPYLMAARRKVIAKLQILQIGLQWQLRKYIENSVFPSSPLPHLPSSHLFPLMHVHFIVNRLETEVPINSPTQFLPPL